MMYRSNNNGIVFEKTESYSELPCKKDDTRIVKISSTTNVDKFFTVLKKQFGIEIWKYREKKITYHYLDPDVSKLFGINGPPQGSYVTKKLQQVSLSDTQQTNLVQLVNLIERYNTYYHMKQLIKDYNYTSNELVHYTDPITHIMDVYIDGTDMGTGTYPGMDVDKDTNTNFQELEYLLNNCYPLNNCYDTVFSVESFLNFASI